MNLNATPNGLLADAFIGWMALVGKHRIAYS
jgi:hypothetical protein